MGTVIGITVTFFAIAALARTMYKREQRNEELLRSMDYAREKINK
jgi:hypothetical protein